MDNTPTTPIRRTVYRIHGKPVTLAYLACIGDTHPELVDEAPPPAPAEPKVERGPSWTDRNIRRALGRDPEVTALPMDSTSTTAVLHSFDARRRKRTTAEDQLQATKSG